MSKSLVKVKRTARRIIGSRPEAPGPITPASERFFAPIHLDPQTTEGPTIVLLNDCRDQINFGGQALVEGLLRLVQRRLPGATVLPIPSHWMVGTRSLDPYEGRGVGFREPSVRYPKVADQFESVADLWAHGGGGRDVAAYVDRFRSADLVLLNGEGSIYRVNSSAVRELFLAWLAKERLGVRTVFANGGVHLTDVDPVLPAMVRKVFPQLDAVAVREPRSLRNLAQYAPEVAARMFPDAAFVFTADEARKTPAVDDILRRVDGAPFFCFDPGPMPIDHEAAGSALDALITAVKADRYQAVLLCKDPTDGFLADIAERTGSLFVDSLSDFREYMALTSRAQFVVSGRYHNTILASITGCPTVTFATASHKIHGACELLEGVLGRTFDSTSIRPDLDEIVAHAHRYATERNAWRQTLTAVCERRRSEVAGLADLIAGVVTGTAVE